MRLDILPDRTLSDGDGLHELIGLGTEITHTCSQRTDKVPMLWVPVPSGPYCASVTLAFASAGKVGKSK